MSRVLVVEDDAAVRDIVGIALEEEGMEVEAASNGEEALEYFSSSRPFDMVILDIMLPDTDGITLCQTLRKSSEVPVVMLTARDDETSVVVGLEVGADDYVTKPFSPRELVSRVRANLRRRRMDAQSIEHKLEFPGLVIDLLRRQVVLQGDPIDLTTTEFDILRLLAAHPGRVFSRQQIMHQLWNTDFYAETRSVDTHIQHLRKKIETDSRKPRYIQTARGVGYKFAEI
jgi:two-component system alkaline phosphatase synthesis response regulator PhoP